MSKLDHLKIKSCPAAFETIAEKINDIVGLLETMEGALGIDVQVAHTPREKVFGGQKPGVAKPGRGKILVTGLAQQLQQVTASQGDNTSGGSSGNGTSKAVGANGVLFDVLLPSSPSVGGYPSQLVVGNIGSTYTQIDPTGFVMVSAGPDYVFFNTSTNALFSGLDVDLNNGASLSIYDGDFTINSSGTTVSILSADITRNMSIKTISVCVNGNSMSMLVLASEPF